MVVRELFFAPIIIITIFVVAFVTPSLVEITKNNRHTSCVEKLVPYVSENGVSMDEITNVCKHYLE